MVVKPGAAAVMRQRLKTVLVGLPLAGLTVGAAATQVVASRLAYRPALGAPLFWHVYLPWRFFQWQQQPWAAYDPKTFAIGRAIVFGSLMVASLGVMASARRKPRPQADVHGTARYATRKEVERGGLLPARDQAHDGLYVGALPSKAGLDYLRHAGAEHLLASAPMRTGKTLGLCLPNLLSWSGSTVVYDPKGELWDMTAGWRCKESGNIVMRWEPGGADNTVFYNFFDDVRLGTPHEYGDMADIMEAIADPHGKGLEGHFDPEAARVLVGVALHVCYERRAVGGTASLADVRRALNDPDRDPEQLFRAMVRNTHLSGQRHQLIAETGQSMLNKEVRERSSVQSTATRMLRSLTDPILARNTSRSDFSFMDLMNQAKPVSLYIVLPEDQRLRLRPLVRLFVTRMMDRLCSVPLAQSRTPHRHRMLLMMDEFPSLGRMETFVNALARCPGYGIRAFILVQDREQLVGEYGDHETVTGMCHIRIAYVPNELRTAEWVSKMAGTVTVNKEDISESGGRSPGQTSTSRSYHTVSRNLLNPDEVLRLKAPVKSGETVVAPGESLVFVSGMFPILATQSLYFFDPEMLRRAQFPAPRTQRIRRSTAGLRSTSEVAA